MIKLGRVSTITKATGVSTVFDGGSASQTATCIDKDSGLTIAAYPSGDLNSQNNRCLQ